MDFFGNEAVRSQIPPIVGCDRPILLEGPPGIGKRTWLTNVWAGKVPAVDKLQVTWRLDVATARSLLSFGARAPYQHSFKVALLDLDFVSHPLALNALLKLLEEPPSYLRIGMTSFRRLPATIRSRALVYQFRALSDDELLDALTEGYGWPEARAVRAASLAQGSFKVAFAYRALSLRRNRAAVILSSDFVQAGFSILGCKDNQAREASADVTRLLALKGHSDLGSIKRLLRQPNQRLGLLDGLVRSWQL